MLLFLSRHTSFKCFARSAVAVPCCCGGGGCCGTEDCQKDKQVVVVVGSSSGRIFLVRFGFDLKKKGTVWYTGTRSW